MQIKYNEFRSVLFAGITGFWAGIGKWKSEVLGFFPIRTSSKNKVIGIRLIKSISDG